MKQPFVKHITTFLFLVAFLIPRMVDIHAFDHVSGEDDPISCELCDSISHTQELDLFLGTLSYTTEDPIHIPNAYVAYRIYDSPLAKIATPTTVYNKPPPIILLG